MLRISMDLLSNRLFSPDVRTLILALVSMLVLTTVIMPLLTYLTKLFLTITVIIKMPSMLAIWTTIN